MPDILLGVNLLTGFGIPKDYADLRRPAATTGGTQCRHIPAFAVRKSPDTDQLSIQRAQLLAGKRIPQADFAVDGGRDDQPIGTECDGRSTVVDLDKANLRKG